MKKKQFKLPPPKPASEKKVPKKPKASPGSDAKGATPGSAKASKKKKGCPSSSAKTATPATATKSATSSEKTSKKKRPAPTVSEAQVKLFAGFMKKKSKTQE